MNASTVKPPERGHPRDQAWLSPSQAAQAQVMTILGNRNML